MRQPGFTIRFIIMLIVQICICNFFRLSQYVTLTILPVIILLLPIRRSTTFAMFLAFLSGLLVDFLADGMPGLNALALVPVAFLKNGILRLVFGEEIFARKEDVSIQKQGAWKMSIAIIMAQALFLAIYIWTDGAGTRPEWFNLARFAASLASGYVLSLLVTVIMTSQRAGSVKK